MAINKLHLTTLSALLLAGQSASAESRSHHPNPMDILSGRHHRQPVQKVKKQKPKPSTTPSSTPARRPAHKKPVMYKQSSVQDKSPVVDITPPPAPQQDETLETINLDETNEQLSAMDILSGKTQHTNAPRSNLGGMTLPGHMEANNTSHQAKQTLITVNNQVTTQEPNSETPTGQHLKILLSTKDISTLLPTFTKPNGTIKAPKDKTLYMTFDDGPIGGTENLLRVLREENVKATMFCIGREVVRSPKLFQEELAMPNLLVANHTYTHANGHYRLFYSNTAHLTADINKAQNAIGGAKYLRLCGRNVWRLPVVKRDDWGLGRAQSGREHSKYNALWNAGYFIYGWDVEWLFSHKTQRPLFDGQEMARRVNSRYQSHHTAKPGRVVLLAHDFMFRSEYNTQQLRSFIHIMKAQGWVFKTIDDYSPYTPDAFVHPPAKTEPIAVPVPANQPKIIQSSLTVVSPAVQLSRAIQHQSLTEVQRLLKKGARINDQDPQGELPLNLAIKTRNLNLVRMLVEHGARIFHLDAEGMSPMGVAHQQGNTGIISYLKDQIKSSKKQQKSS